LAGYNHAIGEFHGNKETLRIKFKDVEVQVAIFAVPVFAILSFFRTVLGLVTLTTLFRVGALTAAI
jgi:hypothetical protein